MNTQQIELVQASFEMVRPIADQAAETFYQRLFEIAPHLYPGKRISLHRVSLIHTDRPCEMPVLGGLKSLAVS